MDQDLVGWVLVLIVRYTWSRRSNYPNSKTNTVRVIPENLPLWMVMGGGTNDLLSYSWGPKFSEAGLIPQFNSPVTLPDGSVVRAADLALYDGLEITPTAFQAYPDNLKNFYETGITTINNLSIGSGFSRGSYRFSVSDMQSESISSRSEP